MQSQTFFVITPENVHQFEQAAEAGNGEARQIMFALNAWFDGIRQKGDTVCICSNCSHANAPFTIDGYPPRLLLVMLPAPTSEYGIVAGVCKDCAAQKDMIDNISMVLHELCKGELSSFGQTIH